MLSLLLLAFLLASLLALALYKPVMAFLVSPIIFIFYKIQYTVLGIPFTVLETYVWFLMLGLVVSFFRHGEVRVAVGDYAMAARRHWFHPLWIAGSLLVASTVALMVTPRELLFETGLVEAPVETFDTFRAALGIWKGWMIPAFLWTLMAGYYLRSELHKELLLHFYTLSAAVVTLLSFIWLYGLELPGTLDGRFGGLFVSANYFVFFVAPAFVYQVVHLVNHVITTKKRKMDYYPYAIAIILGMGLLLARSYASWIAIAIIFLGAAFALLPKKWKGGVVSLIVAGLLVVGFFEFQSDKGQAFIETVERSSTSVRLEVYQISTTLAMENPWFGIGLGTYEPTYKIEAHRILTKPPFEWVMLHPHNLVLSMWLYLGIFGLLWILYVFAVWLYSFLVDRSYDLTLPFLYVLIHGVVDTPFWKPDAILIFFLCLMVALPNFSSLKSTAKAA